MTSNILNWIIFWGAGQLVQDGVSLYEVQKLLGHSNIAVTQVYSHLQPEQLHNTVNKIHISMN
jgi:site-specific recombinase XerD